MTQLINTNCDTHAGIICADGALRLVGGAKATQGTVEVCVANQWGTVCDDSWGSPDAQVACRQAGFSPIGRHAR